MNKKLLTLASTKAAIATALMVAAGTALAQTEPSSAEAAINSAVSSGNSMVSLAVAGAIGIAALCMGLFVILKIIGR